LESPHEFAGLWRYEIYHNGLPRINLKKRFGGVAAEGKGVDG
jgi:hypothetical protein